MFSSSDFLLTSEDILQNASNIHNLLDVVHEPSYVCGGEFLAPCMEWLPSLMKTTALCLPADWRFYVPQNSDFWLCLILWPTWPSSNLSDMLACFQYCSNYNKASFQTNRVCFPLKIVPSLKTILQTILQFKTAFLCVSFSLSLSASLSFMDPMWFDLLILITRKGAEETAQ